MVSQSLQFRQQLTATLAAAALVACSSGSEQPQGGVDPDAADTGVSETDFDSTTERDVQESGATRPSAPFSAAWPLSSGAEHGFPSDELRLSCDPALFPNISPAVLRETTHAVVYGELRAVEIPDGDHFGFEACRGDRWDGLRLVIHVEDAVGAYASEVGTELTMYVPTDHLMAWSRRPWWDSAEGVARWSDWHESDPQPVPLVGGRVLLSGNAELLSTESEEFVLRASRFFAVSSDGVVVAQVDSRQECMSRLEVDGVVPESYGNIEILFARIRSDELTPAETEYVAERDRTQPAPPVASDPRWIDCAE